MTYDYDNEERLNRIAEQEIGRNPHSQGLVNAFLPLLIARSRFLACAHPAVPASFELDGIRFRRGIPLIEQRQLFYRDDPWAEMVRVVVSALREGFPSIWGDLERFEAAIYNGEIAPCDFFNGQPKRRENVIHDWARAISVSPPRLSFILSHLKRIALERRRRDLNGFMGSTDWRKGYCPVCGAFPGIAVIQEDGDMRRLHCFQCGQDWQFSRVVCPWCEDRGEKGVPLFTIDHNDRESAFACEQCKRYLITLNHVTDLPERNLDLSAIGLTYLDLIMQGEGYLPMIDCGWNLFHLPGTDTAKFSGQDGLLPHLAGIAGAEARAEGRGKRGATALIRFLGKRSHRRSPRSGSR